MTNVPSRTRDRRVSGTMRPPRTLALLCRWRVSPANGRLECNWELGSRNVRHKWRVERSWAPPPKAMSGTGTSASFRSASDQSAHGIRATLLQRSLISEAETERATA